MMMSKIVLFSVLLLCSCWCCAQVKIFTLSSKTLGGQATVKEVFNGFGCSGENISPELSWSNAPQGTKSFAITMYDKDAPTGSGWWHWVVFNLPISTTSIPSGAGNVGKGLMPKMAMQSITDFGKRGYGGPCPPKGHGTHTYMITVYALDIASLDLDEHTQPALVGFYLHAHAIEKASLVMYYERQ